MNTRVKMIAAVAAVALLLVGGALAAVSATGRGTAHAPGTASRLRKLGLHDIRTASEYLGVPVAQLQGELRSGKSLAQVAQSTPGRSVAGLVSALLAAKRSRLAKLAAALPRRVQAEVARAGGPGAAARGLQRAKARGLTGARASVAQYIGVSPQELRMELESGKTLAEIARAHGRSEAGVIAVLVNARRQMLQRAVSAGALTQKREASVLPKLEARVRKLVNRSLAAR